MGQHQVRLEFGPRADAGQVAGADQHRLEERADELSAQLGPSGLALALRQVTEHEQAAEPAELTLERLALPIALGGLGLGPAVGIRDADLRVLGQAERPEVGVELILDRARTRRRRAAPLALAAAPTGEPLGAFLVHRLAAVAAAHQA